MTRIAHLTDLHLNGTARRRERLGAALDRAQHAGADHLLVTGDLTAHGALAHFEELGHMLSGWPEHAVTIVPGNHDRGTMRWVKALQGTRLGRFARTSWPGATVDHGDVVVVAADTTYPGRAPLFSALGRLGEAQLERLVVLGRNVDKCIVVAMHHGTRWSSVFLFDGLTNRAQLRSLMKQFRNMHVCCGHHHRIFDDGRIFGAGSVVDHPDPLRLYDVVGPRLVPIYRSQHAKGNYLAGLLGH